MDHRLLSIRISDQIRKDIAKKIYLEGEQLPSEFELAKKFGVNRATLQEALHLLEDEGIVVRRYGVGTFVHSKPLFTAGIEEMLSVTDMIIKAKMTPGTIFVSSAVQRTNEEDQEMFADQHLEEVMEIERIRTADGIPVVYCLDKIPYEFVKNHSIHEITSIFLFLEKVGRPVDNAITYIEPIGYHAHVSEVLECPPESSLLLLKQMHYDQDQHPIFYSMNYFRADKFNFHVIRKRDKA